MFGHDAQPTRNYTYGALRPTEGLDAVLEQFRLAHRYRNALVAQELERRKRVENLLQELFPVLLDIERQALEAAQALEEARAAIRRANSQNRSRKGTKTERAHASELREALRTLRRERKRLRTEAFGSDRWKTAQAEIDAWDLAERKRLRAESGLGWGTYLMVERSLSGIRRGAPPRFRAWSVTRDVHAVAAQLQNGLSVAGLYGCEDRRLRIEPLGDGAWKTTATGNTKPRSKKSCRTVARIRIGSDGRDPIWAVVPLVLHRPIPEDGRIKWAYLQRRYAGAREHWELRLTVAREKGWDRVDWASSGAVGIDVGWRMCPDGSLRVACWSGSDRAEGKVVIPAGWLSEWRKTEHLRSLRDDALNEILPQLAAWLDGVDRLPDWLKEEKYGRLRSWRSHARLAALVARWRDNRWEGDETGFALAHTWFKRERHLWQYESDVRDQLLGQRRDLYRRFAAELRRRYRVAILEELDLRKFHELPEAEDDGASDQERAALRAHVRHAGLSVLIQALKESIYEVWRVDQTKCPSTQVCAACGHLDEHWRASKRVVLQHRCPGCGVREDQDRNAARVLLASAEMPQEKVPAAT